MPKKLPGPRALVNRWIKALRSGKYKQGRGSLHAVFVDGTEKFCCLGVACDVVRKAGYRLPRTKLEFMFRYGAGADKTASTLPKRVVKLLGISDCCGTSAAGDGSLIEMNDEAKRSFKYIARIIESRPKGLFRNGGKR